MNIVDIIILVVIGLGMIIGFSRGFFKETISFIGTILVVVLAFLFKNPLSLLMYKNLPFIKLGGVFEGLSSLNILLYEFLAFIIMLSLLAFVLTIILKLSGIVEKILKMTIILAIPSKILGMVIGFIHSIVVIYVVLFILSLPMLKVPYINESKYTKLILDKTPFLSSIADDAVKTFNEIAELSKDNISIKADKKLANRNMVEIMLKNKVTTTESIEILVDKGKINIDNVDELINKYKED